MIVQYLGIISLASVETPYPRGASASEILQIWAQNGGQGIAKLKPKTLWFYYNSFEPKESIYNETKEELKTMDKKP